MPWCAHEEVRGQPSGVGSLYHTDFKDQIQVNRFGSRHLYPLRHLASLLGSLKWLKNLKKNCYHIYMVSVLLYIREFYSKLALEGTSTNTDVLEVVHTDASFPTTLSNSQAEGDCSESPCSQNTCHMRVSATGLTSCWSIKHTRSLCRGTGALLLVKTASRIRTFYHLCYECSIVPQQLWSKPNRNLSSPYDSEQKDYKYFSNSFLKGLVNAKLTNT